MTNLILNPDYENLLGGLSMTRLATLTLQFEEELSNFDPSVDLLIGEPVLTATGLTVQFDSSDPFDTTPYTLTVSGSGISPADSLDSLLAALDTGTADGTISQIRVDYGSQTILQFDIAPGGLTLSSGDLALELTGGFPVTLSEIISVMEIIEGVSEGSLDAYGFTGAILRDGGEVLASLTLGQDLVLDLDGYSLVVEDLDIQLPEVVDFIMSSQAEITPVLRDIPGISFSAVTITAPDGTVILSATEVDSFASFIDALDAELNVLDPGLPDIGGLGLAFATGDPHLLTHDGLGYDFHAAGEYVLMRATDGAVFELQARMEPAGENVTANTAAAIRIGGDTIMISATGAALRVNGVETALADEGSLSLDGATIARQGNSYRIFVDDPVGGTDISLVQVDLFANRVDIGVGLSDYWKGNVEGLLGNFSGNINDDLRVAGTGEAVSFPLQYGDDGGRIGLYGSFRESWRVGADDTLFTYADGFGPDSYYLADYPGQMVTFDEFSADALLAAESAAEAAGLTPGTFAFQNAVLDLLITGDESFIESAQNTQVTLDSGGAQAGQVFVPEVTGGGITDQLLSVAGRVADISGDALDNATVTFRPDGSAVVLTRLTREGDSFEFKLSQGASGRLEASREWAPEAGDPTVSAGDALDVLRMAVGIAPSFGQAKAQNFIAADLNGDGQVTAGDALDVLRAAVGLEGSAAPRWVFFDAATDWDALGSSNTAVNAPETGIDLDVSGAIAGLEMQGILLGHMAPVLAEV